MKSSKIIKAFAVVALSSSAIAVVNPVSAAASIATSRIMGGFPIHLEHACSDCCSGFILVQSGLWERRMDPLFQVGTNRA